jgi:hypothetical protein
MSRSALYHRLEATLTRQLGVRVRIDWDHARARDQRPGGHATALWSVEWADGPTVPTMRGHVERASRPLGIATHDVKALRYSRHW